MKILKNIAIYVKDKISTNEISIYITTDNMLQNKEGIDFQRKINIPKNTIVTAFKKGDILISNIRPYLKKIWLADIAGGCSSDILVFRSKTADSNFLYSCLMQNNFFKFAMLGSKGTKMPRGDKDQILRFPIKTHEFNYNIGLFIKNITLKIIINNKINNNLFSMVYDIYMHSFFSKIPNAKLSDILIERDKSTIQVGEAKNCNGKYPFFTSGANILTWNDFFVDGRNILLNTGGNADIKFYCGKAAFSTDTWCISTNNNMTDYLYLFLYSIKQEIQQKFFQGTGLKHLQKALLRERPIYAPKLDEIVVFNKQVEPMFNIISKYTRENKKLIELRDWLLPMLMNGQVTIED